jgi:beta-galactosidase/beta-glucuronidase
VKVDHTLDADSRWYTGSGIYRDVKLISTEPVHLKEWGIFCRTSDVSASDARLQADITVMNETGRNANIKVTSTLMYGNEVIGQVTDKISFKSSPEKTVTQAFNE